MSKNEQLIFDLNSLDENSKEFEASRKTFSKLIKDKKLSRSQSSSESSNKFSIGVIIVFIIVIIIYFSGGSESSQGKYTTQVGNYMCSSTDANTAEKMEPSENESISIDGESNRLLEISDQIDSLEEKIDNSTVNEYSSQFSINIYNRDIENYNKMLEQYETDLSRLDSRVEAYNRKVESYNKYLESNCK